jgi:hypothetical protein
VYVCVCMRIRLSVYVEVCMCAFARMCVLHDGAVCRLVGVLQDLDIQFEDPCLTKDLGVPHALDATKVHTVYRKAKIHSSADTCLLGTRG